jgi:exopolysaccharide biosynthesis polyprenyl glycosylphosphotransferase
MAIVEIKHVDAAPDPLAAAEARQERTLSVGMFRRIITSTEIATDFMTSVVCICAAYYLHLYRGLDRHVHYPDGAVAITASIVGGLIPLLLEREGAYRGGSGLLRIRETERIIRISWLALLLVLPLTYFTGRTFSMDAWGVSIIILPLGLIVEKQLLFSIIRTFHAYGYGVRRVVIYGAGETGRRMFSALLHSPKLGLLPVMIIDDREELEGKTVFELGYHRTRSFKVQRGPVTTARLASCRCDLLVIAIPSLSRDRFPRTLHVALQAGAEVAFLPNWAIGEDQCIGSIDIDGMLLTTVGNATMKWHYRIAKRVFDVCVSLILLCILSPLLTVIALLVRLGSTGPVLFSQERCGINGRLFTMYKFRSMRPDSPRYEASPRNSADPRITTVGRFLRRTSLDELPQLLNVLIGDMSLVGPRPEMPFIVGKYDAKQRQRLQVIPGITGLWQLSADRDLHIHENLQYDLYYIRHRSFFFDFALLVHTGLFAMRGV